MNFKSSHETNDNKISLEKPDKTEKFSFYVELIGETFLRLSTLISDLNNSNDMRYPNQSIKVIVMFSGYIMVGKLFWFFCAVVALSAARAIHVKDADNLEIVGEETFKVEPHIFENKILRAINQLKDFLQNGDPESGIPPLDPYYLPYQDFKFFIMDSSLKGYFENTTFANFSRFQPENIEFKLLPLHFQLDLLLPQFRMNGKYQMEGIIFNKITVNGTGKFTSETKNLTLSLYLRPTQVNSSLQIKDLLFEFKTLSQKINYTNELMDDKVHVLDENLALYILDQIQAKYVPPLLNLGKLVLNHFLLGYTYADIMKIILEFLKKS